MFPSCLGHKLLLALCALGICALIGSIQALGAPIFQFQQFFGNPMLSPEPIYASVDATGNLYIVESSFAVSDIAEFDRNHTFLGRFGSGGFVAAIAVAPNGAIYTSNGTNLSKYSASHNLLGTVGSGFDSAYGLAADSASNIYVADTGNNRIVKLDASSGAATLTIHPGGDQAFNRPYGIAVDNGGSIYVADTFNNRVERFDSSGNYLRSFSTVITNHIPAHPIDLTVAADGRIFLTDDDGVLAFSNRGTFLETYDGVFGIPRSPKLDGNTLYVVDRLGASHDRIAVFTIPDATKLQFDEPSLSVSNSVFNLQLRGAAGTDVVVERSFDLVGWKPIQTNTISASGLDLSVPTGTNQQQFLRARLILSSP
jgi:DNA-binding beta-propeller fold protein YncE